MSPDDIRGLVERFFAARADDADAITELLSHDAVWVPPTGTGLGAFHGRDAILGALTGDASRMFELDTMRRHVHQIVVEGDTAVAFMTTTAELANGQSYENEYVWRCRCADGRITRLDEYTDTLRGFRQLGLI